MLLIVSSKSQSMRDACHQSVFMEVECVQSQFYTVVRYIIKCKITWIVLTYSLRMKGASYQPVFMGECLTICHMCIALSAL